jgi:hypothetical protein
MKSFKDLTSSLQLEAKATYCSRCGTVHVPPSQGGTCPALKKEETEIEEAHQVVAKTKEGETFRSAKYPTKKQAMDMHYKMAKSNKYAKVDTVKVQEEVEQIDETYSFKRKTGRQWQGNNLGTSSAEHELHFQGSPTGITLDGSTFGYAVRHNGKRVKKAYNFKDAKDAAVDYHKSLNEEQQGDTMSSMEQYLAAIEGKADFRSGLEEKKLTPAEMKKREEVAKAIERENPDMPMSKKMAIATATAKKVAEEAEELDEISTAAKQNYINAAAMDVARHGNMLGRAQVGKSKTAANVSGSKIDKRLKGIATATSKLTKEETEGMHYCAKHVYSERFGEGFVVEGSHAEPDANGLIEWYDVDFGGTVRRVMTEKVKVMHAEYHNNHKRKMSEEDKPHTIPKTAKEKSLAALAEPKDKITHADVMVGRGVKKEEIDLDEAEAWKKEEKWKKSEPSPVTDKSGAKHTEMSKVKHLARMAVQKTKKEMAKEEVEQIDELSKDTLKSYMGKAAKENLANLIKPGEEAKAKAAKRFSGMMKASEKMAKEEVDLEEAIKLGSKVTIHSPGNDYHGKTGRVGEIRHGLYKGAPKTYTVDYDYDASTARSKSIQLDKKNIKQVKEDIDLEEAMISYSDFMDKIKSHRKAGHKVVDDKYTSGKATFTTITPDGTGRKVTHTPQGHKMEVLGKMDGEDDGAAEVKPTEKRGRGRPAGSKSGARTQ